MMEIQMPKTTMAGLLLLMAAVTAQAQTAKPDTAEAAAAMERAQRIAANPMRIIMQAGKINRKGQSEDSAPVAQVAPARPAAPVVVASSASLPLAARVVAVAAVSPEAAAPQPVYNTVARLDGPAVKEATALSNTSSTVAVDEPLLAPAPSAALVASVVAPKIKRMVEPSFPANVQDELSRVSSVTVKFNIAADGSVSDVVMQQPAPRQLARYVQSAVAEWQFEPLPAGRAHTVQLVFGPQ
jgi:Gram-negative bacterial TonB protein C-terminal